MKRGALLTESKEPAAVRGVKGIAPLKGRRPAALADVISLDRELSWTGLYALDGRSGVKPLKSLDDAKGKRILARTEGLTDGQKEDLKEQGMGIVYVRETPGAPGLHGLVTHERYEGEEDTLYGTKVLPYLEVSRNQALSVLNMASQLPEPREENRARPSTPHDPLVSAMMMWQCAHGGC
jgi:hypothetical protein